MTNQVRFFTVGLALSMLLTSGAIASGEAGPFLPEDSVSAPDGVREHVALPHRDDDAAFRPVVDAESAPPGAPEPDIPELALESSAWAPPPVVTMPPEGDAVTSEPLIDPWAEAFSESSRLGIVVTIPDDPYPIELTPAVQEFLERFTGPRRDVITGWAERSGRYLGMIREIFREKGLPEELAYIAMIESGFNPMAVSRAGAKGLWQFMAPTGRRYGLRVDGWVDERFDPVKSTHAAAAYLSDLHAMFGCWALAKAAYNAGEMRVSRAIQATGSNDFWVLARSTHLASETKNFVPQIHAVTLIAREPERFGVEFAEYQSTPAEVITVPPASDLRRLAVRTGIPAQTLRGLNAVLIRGVTPPGAPYELRIPAGTRGDVAAALKPARKRTQVARTAGPSAGTRISRAATPASRPAAALHVVQPRDTVSEIAKRYGVSVSDVVRWNNLVHAHHIRPGDRLRIGGDVRPAADGGGHGGGR